jgi:uncharacterized protein DUF2490
VTTRTLLNTLTLPSVLLIGLIALATPCVAQDVDTPTVNLDADGRGGFVAPSAWGTVNTPIQKRIDFKLSGFYIGAMEVPVAQVDVPIRLTRFLTVTPSYMGYSVPAGGLNKLPSQPANFTESYDEHQFRIDGTVAFALRKFEISGRNMYVRRFRPTPINDMNRYRGRISIAHPLTVQGRTVKPFASYEAFHERPVGWNRERIWSGVTVPLTKRVFVQPSYMWETSDGNRDVHYVLFGLIVNTRSGL